MMNCGNPKVLIFGESSPSLSYIIWALTKSRWNTIILLQASQEIQSPQRPWVLCHEGEAFDYWPSLVVLSYEDLLHQTHEDGKSIFVDLKFDLILGTLHSYRLKCLDLPYIKKFLHRDTVFLVDTTNDLSVINNVGGYFPDHLVLTMWSDISGIASENFNYCFLKDTKCRVFVGESSQDIEKGYSQAWKRVNSTGSLITRFCSCISVGEFCTALVLGQSFERRVTKIICSNIIRVICFDILSIIFEEPDVTILSQRKDAAHLIKGNYQEILAIARTLGIQDIPIPFTKDAGRLLQVLVLKEKNKMMSRFCTKVGQRSSMNAANLHSNLFHNSMHDFEVKFSRYLVGMLVISNKLGLISPFLEFTFYFISLLFTSGNVFNSNGRKLYSGCPQVGTHGITSFSNILSRKTLSAFSLFKRMLLQCFLPSCTKFKLYPLIFMSGIHSSKMNRDRLGTSRASDINHNSGFKGKTGPGNRTNSGGSVYRAPKSAESVCSSIDELVAGTEYYTYSDEFYDANQNLPRKPVNGEVISENPELYYDVHSQSNVYQHTGPFHNANCCRPQTPYGYPCDYTYPGNNFNSISYSHIPNTATYQMGANYSTNRYNLAHANASHSSTSVTDHSNYLNNSGTLYKGQSFHHVSQDMAKKTSSQKLRESHANLLEMIQFDNLMDKTTSNRYGGDLDTSSTVLHETSNAKSRKNSSHQKTNLPTD